MQIILGALDKRRLERAFRTEGFTRARARVAVGIVAFVLASEEPKGNYNPADDRLSSFREAGEPVQGPTPYRRNFIKRFFSNTN